MSTVEQAVRIETGTYAVDTIHSQIGFEVKHLGISTFRGSFGNFAGEIKVGENGIEGVDGSIEVASVKVPEEKLKGHLLSPDFFDAEANPEGTFKSTKFDQHGRRRGGRWMTWMMRVGPRFASRFCLVLTMTLTLLHFYFPFRSFPSPSSSLPSQPRIF